MMVKMIGRSGLASKFCTHGMLLVCLTGSAGCAQTGSMFSALNPWQKQPHEQAARELMASQQSSARQVQSGQESSIYPPQIVQHEPLPKTEDDLKNPTQLHLTYAKLQEQWGQFTEARSSYEKVISREPKSVEAIIGLGRLDALAGRHAQAESRFRHAIEVSQNSPEATFAFGQYLGSQQRYTESIAELQKATRSAPQNKNYHYELGVTLARAEQYPLAFQTLQGVVSEAEACYNVGHIALTEKRNPALAETYLSRAVALDPELKPARQLLSDLRAHSSEFSTVSGVEVTDRSQVVNAVASQASGHSESRYVMPVQGALRQQPQAPKQAPTPPTGLTAEQWEQWKNQVHPQ